MRRTPSATRTARRPGRGTTKPVRSRFRRGFGASARGWRPGSPPHTAWPARTSCAMAGPRATARGWGTSPRSWRSGPSTSGMLSGSGCTRKTCDRAPRILPPTSCGSPQPPMASSPRSPSATTAATPPNGLGPGLVHGHLRGDMRGRLRLGAGAQAEGVPPHPTQPPAAVRKRHLARAHGPAAVADRGVHAHRGAPGDGRAAGPADSQGRG